MARYAPCGTLDDLRALRCPSRPAAPDSYIVATAARASRALDRGITPEALQAAGLSELSSSDTTARAARQAEQYLEMLVRLRPSATALTDLSAAHLVVASSAGDPRALLAGLDAASRALQLDPSAVAPLYDRALALDLLALNGEATKAWDAYLRQDSSSPYASEARHRIVAIARFVPVHDPDSTASLDSLAAFARGEPGEARLVAWEQLLPKWGEAYMSNDTHRAATQLARARAIGDALAALYGEQSTRDAVTAAASTPSRRLARLHTRYADAQRYTVRSMYPQADSAYREVLGAQQAGSRALAAWGAYGHANSLMYLRRPADAQQAIDSLLNTVSNRYPAVVAKTLWIRGLLQLRASRTDEGLATVSQAARIWERIGERDNVASAVGVQGETMLAIGSTAVGYQLVHRSATLLRAYPNSLWRHNALTVLARAATRAGVPYATQAIEDEDMAVAGSGPRAVSVVEAKLGRARSAWAAGNVAVADRALEDATRLLATIPDSGFRAQLIHERSLTVAPRLAVTNPDSARTLLDSAISFFAPLHFPMKLIPALVARSALAAARDPIVAQRDLDSAASVYLRARNEIAAAAQGNALLAQARDVFDRLIRIDVARRRTNAALVDLAKSRGAFLRSSDRAPGVVEGDESLINYSLLGDSLLTWVVRGGDTSFTMVHVDRRRLGEQIERLRSGMELAIAEDGSRRDLEELYELLVRPIESHVARGDLTIAVDGELANVPFAALRDSRKGEYLVERHAIRFAQGLASAASVPPSRPLIVVDPAFDQRAFPGLPPLTQTEREAHSVAHEYPQAAVLRGAAAGESAIIDSLTRADLFHFAGHAVFNEIEPGRSFLVVGSRGLNATTIATLKLPRLRLVVLSACETVRATDRAGSGFFGLADAFFAAGAHGVIGSTWRVDDAATQQLMERFYIAYRRSGNAAEALREAQVALLKSLDPSPSRWAAFRYAGS
ncbi:MAG: CHAT domain-containing protein [Gemmatimonadaceae bacterium]